MNKPVFKVYRPTSLRAATAIAVGFRLLPLGTVLQMPGAGKNPPSRLPVLGSRSVYGWNDATGWVPVDLCDLVDMEQE